MFVADASLDRGRGVRCAYRPLGPHGDESWTALGFIPTDWYPSALAVHGDDLLIATAKGEGSRANKDMGKTAYETRHKDHPYIPTLLRGSIARLNIPSTLEKLPQFTQVVEHDNLLQPIPEPSPSPAGRIPSST